MRVAALPNFRKLWGRITQNLPSGTYYFNIANKYDVSAFGGTKTLVLSTANAFGGRNQFLAISYLVVGGICFIVAVVFFVKKLIEMRKEN